jgi:hypothetical protein
MLRADLKVLIPLNIELIPTYRLKMISKTSYLNFDGVFFCSENFELMQETSEYKILIICQNVFMFSSCCVCKERVEIHKLGHKSMIRTKFKKKLALVPNYF